MKNMSEQLLKYTKDSIQTKLTKTEKQLQSIKELQKQKQSIETFMDQTKNGKYFLDAETGNFIKAQLAKDLKLVEAKLTKCDDAKKLNKKLSNMNDLLCSK